MKHAFTLIELIVVIGILGILTGVMLKVGGSSTESGRAAKCLANLRSLAQAANANAMETDWYPYAGSHQVPDLKQGQLAYTEKIGWISWLSNTGDPFGKKPGGTPPPAPVTGIKPAAYQEVDTDNALFALTNGTIWKATGCNHDVYCCPTHVKDSGTVNFSYVMNAKFGYDYTQGNDGVAGQGIKYGELARADRVLMFAEVDVDLKGESWVKDSTLQYKANVDGEEYGSLWNGQAESIGFIHPGKHGEKYAHVVFADGHTEKIKHGEGEGGLIGSDLTALLCEGVDVSFDGKRWKKIKDQD